MLRNWLFAAVLLLPVAADAAGLGRLSVLSSLGQPFNAEIELISVQKEDIAGLSARLASPDAYQQANLQYAAALIGMRLSIEQHASGQAFIKLSSSRPVNEPFLDLLIEINWSSGRLVREFTALLDPPGLAPAPAVAAAPVAAPRVRPAPVAPAKVDTASGPGTYGPIEKGETLSKIARSLKPEGVTLEQMLVGIFRGNPDAFINKNMNLVRSGKILRVPERSEIAAVSPAEAVKEYRVQVADWKNYRARLAGAPAAARDGAAGTSGRITTRVDDAATKEAKDVVRLSKGEAPGQDTTGTGGKGSAADRIRTLEEEVAAREKALKEANERVALLEKTIKDMQRLAEIKSAGMAAAQEQAKAKSEPPKADATTIVAAEDKAAPKPTPAQPADQPAPKAAAEKATPKPKPEVKKAPPPPPPPSLIDTLLDNALYLAGGAVIVLGGLGYWLMRRRRQGSTAEPEAKVAPALKTPGGPAAIAVEAPAAPDAELDPLDEANVYITHGREAQAEAVLVDAVAKNTTREALHVKLLEVYALRKDKAAFGRRAEEFRRLTGGRGDNWLKVSAMGAGLDPGNALYGGTAEAAPQASPAPEAAADLDFNLDAVDTGPGEQAPAQDAAAPDIELDVPAAGPKPAAPAPSDADGGAIDFEIEVPKLDAAPTPPPAAAGEADSASALDFKLDLGALDLSLDDKKAGATAPAQAGGHDAHWHDVQAKFDLAKAYQEMGDKAGAVDILKEVLQEGDAEQQAKAQSLLDSLG